jgi:hypothetical protein
VSVSTRSHRTSRFPTGRRVIADAVPTLLAALVVACSALEAKPLRYSATIRVEADPGAPVAGAEVLRDGAALARTDASGRATFDLEGLEGEAIGIFVRCPGDYTSPAEPTRVLLRRNQDAERLPIYRVKCAPKLRTVVIAVRADNGPNLPVVYLGKEVARTDESGVAHAELRLRPGERIELTLNTDDNTRIVPQNPSAVFFAKDRDELLFFDQSFKTLAGPRIGRRRPERLR